MIEYEGKKYARVTEVLSHLNDFSQIPPAVLQRKAEIGTEVHQAIADDIEGRLPILTSGSEGYFVSYKKWQEHLRVEYVASEQRYYDDELMITGQIDALALIGGHISDTTLIDFKTSAQESKVVWPLQAHLYWHLLKSHNIPVQLNFLFLKLAKNGGFPTAFHYPFSHNKYFKCLEEVRSFWENH